MGDGRRRAVVRTPCGATRQRSVAIRIRLHHRSEHIGLRDGLPPGWLDLRIRAVHGTAHVRVGPRLDRCRYLRLLLDVRLHGAPCAAHAEYRADERDDERDHHDEVQSAARHRLGRFLIRTAHFL